MDNPITPDEWREFNRLAEQKLIAQWEIDYWMRVGREFTQRSEPSMRGQDETPMRTAQWERIKKEYQEQAADLRIQDEIFLRGLNIAPL